MTTGFFATGADHLGGTGTEKKVGDEVREGEGLEATYGGDGVGRKGVGHDAHHDGIARVVVYVSSTVSLQRTRAQNACVRGGSLQAHENRTEQGGQSKEGSR